MSNTSSAPSDTPDTPAPGGPTAVPDSNGTSDTRPGELRFDYASAVRRAILPPVIALVFFVGLLIWQVFSLLSAAKWVDHTDEVIGQANRTLSLLLDMQAGSRGYLVGADKRFLVPYNIARPEVDPAFQELLHQVADNPDQVKRVTEMRNLFHVWAERVRLEIALRPGRFDYAAHFNRVSTRLVMPELRQKFAAFQEEEERLRTSRVATQSLARLLLFGLIIASLLLGPLLFWSTFYEMRRLALGYESLVEAEQQARENLSATLYGIGDAVMVTDELGRVQRMNPVAEQLTGWTETEAKGKLSRLVFDILNETTREPVESPIERVLREGVIVGLANHTVLRRRNNAGEVAIDDSGAPVRGRDGRLIGVVLVFRDVTERRTIESALEDAFRRERLVNEVGAAILSSPLDTETILKTAVTALGQAIGADRCYFGSYDPARDRATLFPEWYREGLPSVSGEYTMSRFSINRVSNYLHGGTQVVIDVRDFTSEGEGRPEPGPLEELGLRSLVRVPLQINNGTTVLAVAMADAPRQWTENEVRAVETVASQLQSAVEAARLLAEEQARAASEHVVARISAAVLADGDPEEVRRLAAAALGEALHADRCYFLSVDTLRESILVDADWRARSELPELAARYRLTQLDTDLPNIFGEPGGETLVIPDIRSEPNETRRLIAERLGMTACLSIPFLDRDGALAGALGVAMSAGPRNWTDADVTFAETVAAQTRSAVEAARLQQRERNIASQLQEALVPSPPSRVPGLDLVNRYRPALDEAGVGGDFLDIFPIDGKAGGRTALVVADLAGKGLAAAAQVSTVRNMLRTVLYDNAPLASSVIRLNSFLTEHNLLSGFATLFVGLYDPVAATLQYVSCGQEPGLLRRAHSGEIEELEATGPVLGAFAEAIFIERTVSLDPGDLLALFTDGLTEVGPSRRDLLNVSGVSALFARAASSGNDLNGIADQLLEGVDSYARGGVRDDVCLLLARQR